MSDEQVGITSTFDQEKPVRELEAHEWLELGVLRGWCSDSVCITHDGLPSTPEEDEKWDNGFDPCVPAVRLL